MAITAAILEYQDWGIVQHKRIDRFQPMLLGRAHNADILLPAKDDGISRKAAYLELTPNDCMLTLVPGASGSVFRNDAPVHGRCRLTHGDELRFGKTTIRVFLEIRISECHFCSRPVEGICATDDLDAYSVFAHQECVNSAGARDERIGPYLVIGELGGGGAGRVFQVYEESMRRLWALKIRTNSELARRFDREMYQLQALRHTNIVGFTRGHVDSVGTPYFIMEYARSGNIGMYVNCLAAPERTAQVLRLMKGVLEALSYLHGQGRVHRDIKPDNILVQSIPVTAVVTAKLSDFGLVKAGDAIDLTGDASVLGGTLPFIPPEQIDGFHEVDSRSDIYGIGLVFYYLLSGRLPFEYWPDMPRSLAIATIQSSPRIPLSTIRPDLPSTLSHVVDRACSLSVEGRIPSAAEFKNALQEVS